jgi:hypothetical protein
MSDEQLRRWFEQFRDGPPEPMRMPSAHEIRRRARIWWATRLGGALVVAMVAVCAVPLVARQLGGDRTPTALGPTPAPSSTPVPSPTPAVPPITGPLEPPQTMPPTTGPPVPGPTLPHSPVTSPASGTFQIQPTRARAGQTVTLTGQGCTKAGVGASELLVTIEVESPNGNDRVAWLLYPVGADGSWQGQWRIPNLPSGIRYGPGFQLQPSCEIALYRDGSKSVQGTQYIFSYDRQRLTIQSPLLSG